MTLRWLPQSVFGQLALVIALTLAGTGVLAIVLGRELATRPAAEQLLQAMNGFANVVEELARHQPRERIVQQLRDAGLQVRDTAPTGAPPRVAPFMRELEQQAGQRLGPHREIRLERAEGAGLVWVKLDTQQPMWVSFAYGRPDGRGVRRFSVSMLLGCVVLVWMAAAYFARRLALPLRRLAYDAGAIVQGDASPTLPASAPREVAELAQALRRAGDGVRSAAQERAFLLAGISHDLRTPLTRLQFALELVPGTDDQLRAGMHRDIAEMDAILTQFIAFARDGRDEASERVDLAAIVRHAVAASSAAWTVDAPQTAILQGKPMALLRATENLLVNAQRHGAPPFAVRLYAEGLDWVVEVCDRGPGLSSQAAQRALQPFEHDSRAGGSGLGLPIVERVARQHGGELKLLGNTPNGLCAQLWLRGA